MSYKSILLSVLSATLLILAFPKPNLWFLAWFALVPWFFGLQKQRPRSAFLLSYLVGLMSFSGMVYWVNYVSGLGFTVLVLYLALYFAAFGLIFSTLKHAGWAALFFIPAVWVGLEYIRSHLFSGFGWALLGHSQYSVLPVIQISDITGAYGVSFLLVLVNIGIYQVTSTMSETRNQKPETRKKILYSLFCILCSVIIVLAYGYFRLSQQYEGQRIKVAVVQGNIPQTMKWDPQFRDYILERYVRLTEQTARNHPQIIIWPETAVPGYLEDDPQLLQEIISLSKRIAPADLLVGTPQAARARQTLNSATLLSSGAITQRYDKLHLVPFGEFIPWPQIFSRFSFAGLIGDFSSGKEYTVFSISQALRPTQEASKGAERSRSKKTEVKISALICFEDVFAHLTRRFVKKGAQVLVNMTNDAWFENSSEPYQHLQSAVFRAIENRVSVVRSANTGISCFIDPWGKILSRVADDSGRDVLVAGEKTQAVPVISASSFYTAFGDVFAWFCVAVSLIMVVTRKFWVSV